MIFKELESTDKVAGRVTTIHNGIFSGDHPGELSEFFHPDLETQLAKSVAPTELQTHMDDNWTKPQKEDYYAEIYQEEVVVGGLLNDNAEQQFTVTYGNINGFGSILGSAFNSKSPKITKTIYSQHKNILLNPDDKKFTFTKKIDNSFIGYNSDSIYVINFASSRMKEKLDEGNFMFTLGVEQTVEATSPGQSGEILNVDVKYKVSFQDNSVFGSNVNYITSSPQFGRVFDLVKILDSDRYNASADDTLKMNNTPQSFMDNTGPDPHLPTLGQDIRYCPGENLSFGLVYPDLGIIVLNPAAIADQLKEGLHESINQKSLADGWNIHTSYSKEENEGAKLSWYGDINPFGGISEDFDPSRLDEDDIKNPETWANITNLKRVGGDRNYQNFKKLINALNIGGRFECRSTEIIPSKHYFIRIKNTDFNYSNNPSFVYQGFEADLVATRANASKDEYLGRIRNEEFIIDPRVYITTIGLYNEDNDLVAVAKLSNPILKTFDSEALIKVKLDF